jgi:hypothetical protein|tara:strand:- start:115 stop:354 length:240 start_codon:yes stop_codon:yes gene_type:complete
MTDDEKLLDQAAQKIADARSECLKLGVAPTELAKIMMDEATLGLIAGGKSLTDIQGVFKRYVKKGLVRFYTNLRNASGL